MRSSENNNTVNTAGQDLTTAPLQPLKRRLLSGGAWAFGGKILVALTGLISSVLLARLLTPQAMGTYFLAYSILNAGVSLGQLGLTGAVVRLVAQDMGMELFRRVRRVISVALGFGTLGALGVGLAYLLFGDDLAIKVFDAPALAAITGLMAGWLAVAIVQEIFGESFRGFHDIRLASLLGGQTNGGTTGVATLTLRTACLFLIWCVSGHATLSTVVLLGIFSGAANTLVAGWLLHRRVTGLPPQTSEESHKVDPKPVLGEVLSVSWPLLIISAVMMFRINGDTWMVGAFLPQEELALYGAANRLVSMVTMPLAIVSAIAPPLIAEMYSQGRREDLERALRSMATLTGIPAWLASIGCIFFASPILDLVYGNYYREGAAVLVLLSIGQFANVCSGACGFTLAYTGHQKMLMVITSVTSAATLIAMFAAVEPYGIVGVAVAKIAGQILQNVIVLLVVKQKTGMWTHVGFRAMSRLWRSTG